MAEQTCKNCHGLGRVEFQRSATGYYTQACRACDGTGTISRTAPYRLQDGAWSDGVDRSKRICSTYFAMTNKGRWHVYKGFKDIFTDCEWRVYSDRGFLRYFTTQEQAIAYADNAARNAKN